MSDDGRRVTAADLLGAEMPSIDPLLCERSVKAELESANSLAQLDYIEEQVAHYGATSVREMHILALQKHAVKGIYPCAGSYRTARHDVFLTQGGHVVPEAALVPSLVQSALDRLEVDRVAGASAIDRAAYALWRFNWIHPFAGGNGRTARAIAYLIVCMDQGTLLLGKPTMPTSIASRTDEYENALRRADAMARETGEDLAIQHLGPMKILMTRAYLDQVMSVLGELKVRVDVLKQRRRRKSPK